MKSKLTRRMIAVVLTAGVVLSCGFAALSSTSSNEESAGSTDSSGNKYVHDYSQNKPDITGDKVQLNDMTLAEKQWFEYVDYEYYMEETAIQDGVTYIYRFYAPIDYSASSIMAIRDYNPNDISGSKLELGTTWDDLAPLFANIACANLSVMASGGLTLGIVSAIEQEAIAIGTGALFQSTGDIIKNAPYYNAPEFMGIAGTDWKGVSKTGFYNADSLTIQMDASVSFSVAKTNTINSEYSVGGNTSAQLSAGLDFFDLIKVGGEAGIESSASSALGYGVDFQQSQSVNNSVAVSRTFNSRTDSEVANVGWKLCEYIVKVPYRVDMYRIDGNEELLINSSFVEYNLLQGVCRVFANGYIEHWNTGKLVSYADFFEGFITAEQLIAGAKNSDSN